MKHLEPRPSWDAYFMDIARLVARRATCVRRAVGAVMVRDRHILTTGYNGAPAGMRHCDQTGCLRTRLAVPSGERHELCHGIHAEQNAIIQAACHGISVRNATLYCTHQPCSICAKMLINVGIQKVCYGESYDDASSRTTLLEAGVEMQHVL